LLVEMIEPYEGRVYDPCCGSGGMFVQSAKFVKAHEGKVDNIHIHGQESIAETWRLCKMNLAIRGIDGDLGQENADTFGNDQHKGLKADYILANPPFNIKDWGASKLTDDVRWKYGMPSEGNANYAWIEHMISKMSPRGIAGFVLSNGSMSITQKQEAEIRKNIIEDGKLVDCIVALPPNLFYNVTIPVCLWFLSRKRDNRKDKILFIDARKMGTMETRKHRILEAEEIRKICSTYHYWRDGKKEYQDEQGFCKSVSLEDVRSTGDYILNPGGYVGIKEQEDEGEVFEEKMQRLTKELGELFSRNHILEGKIIEKLGAIGYDVK
jgi:type I restriction enzyme M protein